MRIAITGSNGLLGWHTSARLHARNCAARYNGLDEPFELVRIDRDTFNVPRKLEKAVAGCDAIAHFAGVNRGRDADIEASNPKIAKMLADACKASKTRPLVVYANTIHSGHDTPYGLSKQKALEILASADLKLTELVLPHVFGELARPYYNNVTATLIDQLWRGQEPTVNSEGRVELVHAGEAAEVTIAAMLDARPEASKRISGRKMSVVALFEKLRSFHALYSRNIFPSLEDPFDLALFNTYRAGAFPEFYPLQLNPKRDARGVLFESAKGGDESQSFISTTRPGMTRGDHFHTDLVERFVVVQGEAIIRVRKVLNDCVHEFRVSGEDPVAIDQIPLHTHNIENIGEDDLVTYFWSHRMFDPANPDTFADKV